MAATQQGRERKTWTQALEPKRLKPGFETQLTKKSPFVVYSAFAVGLALGAGRKR